MKQWRFLGSSVMWWYLRIYNVLEPQNPQKSQPVAAPPLQKLQEFLLRPWKTAAPTNVFDFSKPNLWKLFEQVAVSTYICSNPPKEGGSGLLWKWNCVSVLRWNFLWGHSIQPQPVRDQLFMKLSKRARGSLWAWIWAHFGHKSDHFGHKWDRFVHKWDHFGHKWVPVRFL